MDRPMCCMFCATSFTWDSAYQLMCEVCGPSKLYNHVCNGFPTVREIPHIFTCCPEHTKQQNEKCKLIIYMAKQAERTDTITTPLRMVYETELYEGAPCMSLTIREASKLPAPMLIYDMIDPRKQIKATLTLAELYEKTSHVSPIILVVRMQPILLLPRASDNTTKSVTDIAKDALAGVEYNEDGTFKNTPIARVNKHYFPGMIVIQEGASVKKGGKKAVVAICAVRNCSNKPFETIKALKQHASIANHVNALVRQGMVDGETYVLRCSTCIMPNTNNLRASASWPWTHHHQTAGPESASVLVTIKSPSDPKAGPYIPVAETNEHMSLTNWIRGILPAYMGNFPPPLETPMGVFHFEDTIIFAYTGSVDHEYDDYISNTKFRYPDNKDVWWRLMRVPFTGSADAAAAVEQLSAIGDVKRRVQFALECIAQFVPPDGKVDHNLQQQIDALATEIREQERALSEQKGCHHEEPTETFIGAVLSCLAESNILTGLAREEFPSYEQVQYPPAIDTIEEAKESFNALFDHIQGIHEIPIFKRALVWVIARLVTIFKMDYDLLISPESPADSAAFTISLLQRWLDHMRSLVTMANTERMMQELTDTQMRAAGKVVQTDHPDWEVLKATPPPPRLPPGAAAKKRNQERYDHYLETHPARMREIEDTYRQKALEKKRLREQKKAAEKEAQDQEKAAEKEAREAKRKRLRELRNSQQTIAIIDNHFLIQK